MAKPSAENKENDARAGILDATDAIVVRGGSAGARMQVILTRHPHLLAYVVNGCARHGVLPAAFPTSKSRVQ